MLDLVWFILLFGGLSVSICRGEPTTVTMALLTESEATVRLALGLVGSMSFWLGILAVAESAGLVKTLARLLRPVLTVLFPTIPAADPAAGSILLNVAANMLGLGNAATPMGLKAMQHLQRLNPRPNTATAAMCTFLALNTCSITLVPTSIIAARMAAGSNQPTATVMITFLSSAIATGTAIIGDRICRYFWGRD
ncbi:MAG TPA: nucleoside recognition domain-containing protein [bacterium]|nr:nucleoside recognition domain-containing protein [bacterium]